MGGSTKVQPSQPSAEERALQQEQVQLLREQRGITQEQMRQQELLAPLMYEQFGISPQKDAQGRITGFTRREDPQEREIQSLLRGRTLAALKGDLPVDPGLERQLKEGRVTLEEQLRKQLGTGFSTSSAGIEALANFDQRAKELQSAARTGQLTLAEQLQQARAVTRTNDLGSVMGISQSPFAGAGMLGQAATGFNNPLSFFGQQRASADQARMMSAQNAQANRSTLGSLFGTGIMAAAMVSDRRLKSDIRLMGKLPSGLNVYRYVIFGQPDIGVMADEVRGLFPKAVKRIAGIDTVNYAMLH